MVAGGRSSGEWTIGDSGGFFSSPAALPARTLGWGERGGGGGPNRAGAAAGGWLDSGSWRQSFPTGGELGEKKRRARREKEEEKEKKKEVGLPHRPNSQTQLKKINPLQIFPFLPPQKFYH
ncbi:hypothetical protein ACLB2K_007097 [Fragaria x ananassa]